MERESSLTLPRWSFGLRQLFLWTAAIALGLVALRSATMTWVAAMLGLALAVLTVSILLVIFRRGPQRAFWIGFATVGWMYLLLVVVSWTLARMAADDNPLRAHNLITQQLVERRPTTGCTTRRSRSTTPVAPGGGSMVRWPAADMAVR